MPRFSGSFRGGGGRRRRLSPAGQAADNGAAIGMLPGMACFIVGMVLLFFPPTFLAGTVLTFGGMSAMLIGGVTGALAGFFGFKRKLRKQQQRQQQQEQRRQQYLQQPANLQPSIPPNAPPPYPFPNNNATQAISSSTGIAGPNQPPIYSNPSNSNQMGNGMGGQENP